MATTEREFNCWNCQYFQLTDYPSSAEGECRRNRPDTHVQPSDDKKITFWPTIDDGVLRWCGAFKRNSGRTIPAVPTPIP